MPSNVPEIARWRLSMLIRREEITHVVVTATPATLVRANPGTASNENNQIYVRVLALQHYATWCHPRNEQWLGYYQRARERSTVSTARFNGKHEPYYL